MAFDPGRSVDEQRKASRVGFGKAVLTESLHALETPLGKLAAVAVVEHALDEASCVTDHLVPARPSSDSPAKPFSLSGSEPSRSYRKGHHLFLKQRHSVRLCAYR